MIENFENYNLTQEKYIDKNVTVKSYITHVFSWMFFALGLTAVIAYWFASSHNLLNLLYTETGISGLGWVITFAPLGLVLLMSFGYEKLSLPAIGGLFALYSILMGMSLSTIFLIYSVRSIVITFAVTGGMFGIMAITGYTTKMDLSKFGSIMFMGLIGIILASIINLFARSQSLDYIVSFIGVLVFTGLTAYDVQKLKYIGGIQEDNRKSAILGALTLYLDVINIFLFLLRFLGNRR